MRDVVLLRGSAANSDERDNDSKGKQDAGGKKKAVAAGVEAFGEGNPPRAVGEHKVAAIDEVLGRRPEENLLPGAIRVAAWGADPGVPRNPEE